MRKIMAGRSLLVAGLLCGAAALQACDRGSGAPPPPLAALPPTSEPAPSLIPGPLAEELPPAPAPRLLQVSNPGDAYAFADRAYAMDAAFADSPPDYDFADDGATPWVWVAGDGSQCVAEYTPAGWRYYYYDPGAAQPFFIADPEYGYGYEGGALVTVYDHYGRAYPPTRDAHRNEIAGQYLARASLLFSAAIHDPHRAVAASDWASQRSVLSAQQHTWSLAQASNPAWQTFRAQHQAQDDAHWRPEQVRREAWAARVDASLGDPGRAQAEWRAAGQTTALAAASPIGRIAPRFGNREPSQLAELHAPSGIDTRGGVFTPDRPRETLQAPPGGPHLAAQTTPPGAAMRGPPRVFAAQTPPVHAPRYTGAPRGVDTRAQSADSFGANASARVPQHVVRTDSASHFAQHGPPPPGRAFHAPHPPPAPQAQPAPPPQQGDPHHRR